MAVLKKSLPSKPWIKSLIRGALAKEAAAYSGVRRIIQDYHWSITELPKLTYADLGYSPAKEKQLLRNYYNPEEFERVKQVLEKRKKKSGLTSVSLMLRAKPKDSRSMGHCMLSLTVSRLSKVEVVDMHYRSTELIFKFGADLVFLRRVFDELGINPSLIRFHFCNAFISGGYWGTLGQFWDLGEFLHELSISDPKFFKSGTRVLLRSAREKDQKYKYSPHNQQHKLIWRVYSPKFLREIDLFLSRRGVVAEVPVDSDKGEDDGD